MSRAAAKARLIGAGGAAVLEPKLPIEESWVSQEWAQCTSPVTVLGPDWESQWEAVMGGGTWDGQEGRSPAAHPSEGHCHDCQSPGVFGKQPSMISMGLSFIFLFNWSRAALQCCVSFCCTAN